MKRQYRVVTKNASTVMPYTAMTPFQSRSKCERFIVARWGHWPPFAFVSSARTELSFVRYNGK